MDLKTKYNIGDVVKPNASAFITPENLSKVVNPEVVLEARKLFMDQQGTITGIKVFVKGEVISTQYLVGFQAPSWIELPFAENTIDKI